MYQKCVPEGLRSGYVLISCKRALCLNVWLMFSGNWMWYTELNHTSSSTQMKRLIKIMFNQEIFVGSLTSSLSLLLCCCSTNFCCDPVSNLKSQVTRHCRDLQLVSELQKKLQFVLICKSCMGGFHMCLYWRNIWVYSKEWNLML